MMSNNNISLFDSDELFFFFFNQQIEFVEYVALFLLFLFRVWNVFWFFMLHKASSQSWSGCHPGPTLLLHLFVLMLLQIVQKHKKHSITAPPPCPHGPAERCDRNELRQAALAFCLFFPPENRKYFLGVRG